MKIKISPIISFIVFLFLITLSVTGQQNSAARHPQEPKEKGLQGFVCDPDGKPFPNAKLLVNLRKIPIQEDGIFFISYENLQREHMPLFLLVNGEINGKKFACARYADYINGEENITIRLFQSAEIFGRIMTPEDKPISGAKVSALINVGGLTCHGTFPVGESASTDETGQFVLRGLYPDSTYKLRVESPGKERKTSDWIPAGTRELINNLKIILRDAPGFVSGCVVDEKSKPLAKERIILGHPCIPDADCLTDSQGRFRIQDLIPGEEVEISVKGNSKRVKVGEQNIILQIPDKKQ